LFHPIVPSSHSNLYSNNCLTNFVSSAKAAIPLLISPGGRTQYLSLISQVVQPESVIAIIAAKFLSKSLSIVLSQYKTLKVPVHHPITDIFNLFVVFIKFVIY
jgi:hypothetical protein